MNKAKIIFRRTIMFLLSLIAASVKLLATTVAGVTVFLGDILFFLIGVLVARELGPIDEDLDEATDNLIDATIEDIKSIWNSATKDFN